MRPARGCSCDGSERGVLRKEETSWAVVGSKVEFGVGSLSWEVELGWSEEEEEDGEGFLVPVRVPQRDIVRCIIVSS